MILERKLKQYRYTHSNKKQLKVVEPSSYFSVLLQATATSISIVLVFVITIHATRQSILHDLDQRFEEESQQLSTEYFGEFDELCGDVSYILSEFIDFRLMFNIGTETEDMTAEKITNWAKKQDNPKLAAVYGHALCVDFSIEGFHSGTGSVASRKQIFENLGDHLLALFEYLLMDEVRQEMIQSSENGEEVYTKLDDMVHDLLDEWYEIHKKNYAVNTNNNELLMSILHICKWLAVIGIFVPLLFLIYIPPLVSMAIVDIFNYYFGITLSQLSFYADFSIFALQISITFAIIVLAWKLLGQLHVFFRSFNIRESGSHLSGPNIEKEETESQDIPKIPEDMFE